MPLVVRPQHVYDAVEATLHELVVVVGDVGGEVGGRARAPDDDLVLVVPERGRPEPRRAVPLYEVLPVPHHLHYTVVLAAREEAALAEPLVVLDVEGAHVPPDLLDHAAQTDLADLRSGSVGVHSYEPVRDLVPDLLCEVDHVRSLVAVGRDLRRLAVELEVPGQQAAVEVVHLAARVVHIVLALDVVSRRVENVGEGAPHHRAPGVARMNGAGRVQADELDLHPGVRPDVDRAERVAGAAYCVDLRRQPRRIEGKVYEARRRGPDPGDRTLHAHPLGDAVGDDHGAHAHLACQPEGEARREVPVLRLLGPLDGCLEALCGRQLPGLLGLRQGRLNDAAYLVSDRHGQDKIPDTA